ncbi:MAG: hypothetical protein L6Q40_09465, partial [Azonexus sp.]|nr:hypothetical protein [Azonexus sp.]
RQQATLTEQATAAAQQIDVKEKALVRLREQHRALSTQLADKRKLLEQERVIQSLSAHRQQLQPGAPCPLCGATAHPAIAHYEALDLAGTEGALKETQAKLDALTETGQKLRSEQSGLQSKHEEWTRQLAALAANQQALSREWESQCAALATTQTLAVDAWQDEKSLRDAEANAASALKAQAEHLQAAEQGELACQAADKRCAETAQTLQQVSARHSLLLQQQQQDTEQAEQAEKQHAMRRNELAALDTSLAAQLGELPSDPTAWLAAKETEWTQWQARQAHRQALGEQLLRHQQTHEHRVAKASEWQTRYANCLASRPPLGPDAAPDVAPDATHDTANAHEPPEVRLAQSEQAISEGQQQDAALQGRQTQLEATLAQQKIDLNSALTAWQQALATSPFPDTNAFLAASLTPEIRQQLQVRKEMLDSHRQQAAAIHKATGDKLGALRDSMAYSPVPPEASLAAALVEVDNERRSLSEQLGALRALLTQDADARSGQQALLAQIAVDTAESDLWQRLDGLIGSAKGDKFRKFAQGLTLDHLLHLANRHLARLHARYLLRRRLQGELDSWQGDVARDTRTLSGGESFLVSLALALALSDLVSQKTSIDSLFLDEGFGTLDGDTLETALAALDTLNASGKMIGIISHVDSLKERIPTQIRVDKGGGIGHSRLSVSGY